MKHYIILLLAVLFLSTSAIFVRLAGAPAAAAAFYRLFFTMLILLPFLLFSPKRRAEVKSLTSRQWALTLLSGVVLAVHFLLWFASLDYTSVASSTVLVTLQPLFSLIGGYFFFQERYNKTALLGCFIAIVGSVIIGWGDMQLSPTALLGDLMAFAAAGVIAVYFLIGQSVRASLSVVPYSVIGYAGSSLFLALYMLAFQVPFSGYSPEIWLAFAGLAVLPTILGQMVFNWLLQWISAPVISMSILGEAVGTCVLSYFILSERISLQQGIGILVILSGLFLFLSHQHPKEQGSAPSFSELESRA